MDLETYHDLQLELRRLRMKIFRTGKALDAWVARGRLTTPAMDLRVRLLARRERELVRKISEIRRARVMAREHAEIEAAQGGGVIREVAADPDRPNARTVRYRRISSVEALSHRKKSPLGARHVAAAREYMDLVERCAISGASVGQLGERVDSSGGGSDPLQDRHVRAMQRKARIDGELGPRMLRIVRLCVVEDMTATQLGEALLGAAGKDKAAAFGVASMLLALDRLADILGIENPSRSAA